MVVTCASVASLVAGVLVGGRGALDLALRRRCGGMYGISSPCGKTTAFDPLIGCDWRARAVGDVVRREGNWIACNLCTLVVSAQLIRVS